MNGEDYTQTLLDRTDALIAKHRQPKGAISPIPDGVIETIPAVPVLTQRLSPEDAALLMQSAAVDAEKENADMQKVIDSTAAASLVCPSDADAIAQAYSLIKDDAPSLPESMLVFETGDISAISEPEEILEITEKTDDLIQTGAMLSDSASICAYAPAGISPSDPLTLVPLFDAKETVDPLVTEDVPFSHVVSADSLDDAICGDSQIDKTVIERAPIDTAAWSEKLSGELAPLVCHLAEEVTSSVLRQMMPDIQKTIEARLHQILAGLTSEAPQNKTDT